MLEQFASSGRKLVDNCDYSIQLNRWFLKPIGAWPLSQSTSKSETIVLVILNAVCYVSLAFAAIPCLLNMILEEESVYMKMKSLGPVSHWLTSSLNYTALLLRQEKIRYCMEHMRSDWGRTDTVEDRRTMLKNAKFGRYVAVACAIFMQGGVLCFCMVTVFTTEAIRVGNETRIVHVLPCAVYKKLLNVDERPMNEIVMFVQIWAAFVANSSTVGIFSLAAVFAAHACGQLEVLTGWINRFVNQAKNRKKDSPLMEIGTIVEHHLRALNFISLIEDIMNQICFLELFRCTMDVCLIGYYILMEWAECDIQSLATYFMMFASICFNIFVLCYIGEILTEQCKKVGEIAYMTDWYYLPERKILDLVLIIARSSVVVHITAGKLVYMSIYTFDTVIKTGFGYLNLLCQMTR